MQNNITQSNDKVNNFFDGEGPISFQIAKKTGKFSWVGRYLRPNKGSGVAELFGHDAEHNLQAYVMPANKSEKNAFMVGGSMYPLEDFASLLGEDLSSWTNKMKKSFPIKKKNNVTHKEEKKLDSFSDEHFKYFYEHGIKNPKKMLSSMGGFFALSEFKKYKNYRCIVLPLHNGGHKYFILDQDNNVIDKLNGKGSKVSIFPSPLSDNRDDVIVCEGFADCIKLREMGYNAFTTSAGINSIYRLSNEIAVKPERDVYICVDRDTESEKFLERIRSEFVKKGHNTFVVHLPFDTAQSEKDICDYFESKSKTEFNYLLERARNIPKPAFPTKLVGLSGELQNVFSDLGYDFRHNIVTNRSEFKNDTYYPSGVPYGDSDGYKVLDNKDFNVIYTLAGQYGNFSKDRIAGMIGFEANLNSYDPFKDYLEGLKWDGNDYISDLCSTLRLNTSGEDKDESKKSYERAFREIRSWLVATAGGFTGESINETVLVLFGKQGRGKTRFFERLLKNTKLEQYFHTTRNINPDNKDHLFWLSTKAIINLDEMAALTKNEVEGLKSLISEKKTTGRGAYKMFEETAPRRASCCGSTNNPRFLKDLTGNRRFSIISIDNVNDSIEIDYEQVWAQAYHLFKNGFRYWLNEEEIEERNSVNEQYSVQLREEELVLHNIFSPEDCHNPEALTTTEIAEKLVVLKRDQGVHIEFTSMMIRNLGKVLSKYEYKRTTKTMLGQSRKAWVVQFDRQG